MVRYARTNSESGVYHVILRGINKQQIFEDVNDYKYFLSILQSQTILQECDGKRSCHCFVYAYCLMSNHIHLLVKEGDEKIGQTLQRIASSYVFFYNKKYERIGHLFQERFKSQPVCSWKYFVTLIRYIHQNPLKAGLVDNVTDYLWSSWKEFSGEAEGFCHIGVVLERICFKDLKELVDCKLTLSEEEGILDFDTVHGVNKPKLTDSEAMKILASVSGISSMVEFQRLSREKQETYLKEAHKQGVSIRALSRLTGLAYSVVQRVLSH